MLVTLPRQLAEVGPLGLGEAQRGRWGLLAGARNCCFGHGSPGGLERWVAVKEVRGVRHSTRDPSAIGHRCCDAALRSFGNRFSEARAGGSMSQQREAPVAAEDCCGRDSKEFQRRALRQADKRSHGARCDLAGL
jgi:hypothetical protein